MAKLSIKQICDIINFGENLKVLQINTVCGIGSTGRIATDLANTLAQNGHGCLVAYGRGRGERFENVYKTTSALGVRLHALFARITDRAGFYSKRATKKLILEIKRYDPDVVHLHNLHGYYLHIKKLFDFLKDYKKPVVFTLHDCWTFTGHCSHFDFIDCKKWLSMCYSCPQKSRYPKSIFFDNSTSNYNAKREAFTALENLQIVVPSAWLKSQVEKSFLKNYPISVIPNGIDVSVFTPTKSDFAKKLGLENKRILLGVAGVWDERKGFYDFLKLSEKLEDGYKLVLVGVNDKQLKTLPENVLGIKHTGSAKELAEIYSAADVFLNLTYEDSFPTVNLEALACDTPVITYRTGGSTESVEANKKFGVVVEKGDIAGVLDAVKNLLDAKKEVCVCAKEARSIYNKERMFSEYIKRYERMLKNE